MKFGTDPNVASLEVAVRSEDQASNTLQIKKNERLNADDETTTSCGYKSTDFGEDDNQLVFRDLPKGEYYIKVSADFGYGAYKITPSFEPWEGNDPEPNDTQAQAVQIDFGQKVTGFVGARLPYYNAEVLDEFDYYRIELPRNGALHLYCTERKLSAASYQLKTNLFSAEEPTDALSFREIPEDETSDPENQTLSFHQYRSNLTAGTYFIEVKDYYGPGAYEFRAEFEPAPVAGFLLAQNNADVTFTNTTKNATEYKWNFSGNYQRHQ